jgi:hypothetical protein
MGHDLGIDMGFAHPAGNQLGVLSAVVNHQHRGWSLGWKNHRIPFLSGRGDGNCPAA